jgi:predicted transcriptional regulator
MAKRNLPQTSKDAYANLKPEQLREVYKKIIEALKILGTASTEQIASYLTMEHAKIHKRVSEMERMQMIYRPGNRVTTKSGCTAFVWCLSGNQPKTDKETTEKSITGTAVVYYSRKLIIKNKDSSKQIDLL